jgi:nucleotide-binding universal stress UspA family protein
MKKILIATDGSDSAHEAVELGLELADEQGTWAHVVHVVPLVDVMPYSNFGFIAPALPHEFDERDYAPLESAVELAGKKGIRIETKLLKGRPADEIVAYADSIDADLIVVGSRGHGAFTNALIGSVSRGVLRESRRPVLIVRGAHVAAEATQAAVA